MMSPRARFYCIKNYLQVTICSIFGSTGHDNPRQVPYDTDFLLFLLLLHPNIISEIYWGLIKSKYSVPAGMPKLTISNNSFLPILIPSFALKLPSSIGSLINPFQPIVVSGFSKYTHDN